MEDKLMNSSKMYNLIILDKSGSMNDIRKEAVDSVNETIGAIRADAKKHPEMEQYVTLASFCGCGITYLIDCLPIEEVSPIAFDAYRPCCTTPLYDAIGINVNKLAAKIGEEKRYAVSVTIITDGYENASKEYSHPAIKSLIESKKKQGWLFAYMGADHDVETVAYELSINNTLSFDKTEAGVKIMSSTFNKAREKWSDSVRFCFAAAPSRCSEDLAELSDDFFDESDDNNEK